MSQISGDLPDWADKACRNCWCCNLWWCLGQLSLQILPIPAEQIEDEWDLELHFSFFHLGLVSQILSLFYIFFHLKFKAISCKRSHPPSVQPIPQIRVNLDPTMKKKKKEEEKKKKKSEEKKKK